MKNKIPPPLIMLFFGLLIYLEDKYFLLSITAEFDHQRIYTLCFGIIGICIALLGLFEFQKAKTTVNPHHIHKASSLVTTGIYRITRNPMYLGMVFLLIAWCIKLGDLLGLFIIPFFMWTMTNLQIKPEEAAMTKLFGQEFENYKKKVRRWL